MNPQSPKIADHHYARAKANAHLGGTQCYGGD